MTIVTVEERVRAPRESVFAALTDFAALPGLIPAVVRIELLTDGPARQGTRFRETRIMFKREASEEMEVAEFEPPSLYALTAESHGCRYRTECRLSTEGDATVVRMEFGAEPVSFLAKLMGWVMKGMIKGCAKAMRNDLAHLKQHLEANAGHR